MKKQDEEQKILHSVQLNVNREKPHNDEAEAAVLGCIMTSPDAAGTALSALRSIPNVFYRPAHQIIFNAIAILNGQVGDKGQDYLYLANYLREQGQLEAVGGVSYLANLALNLPIAKNIDTYVELVKQCAVLRQMIDACAEGVIKGYEATDNPKKTLDEVEQAIFAISQFNEVKDYRLIDGIVIDALKDFKRMIDGDVDVTGLKTGYPKLDDMIVGLKPGDLFVLAARPSVGKTALALNIAANLSLRGKAADGNRPAVGIFSLEMTSQQLVMRLIQSEARVNLRKLQRHQGLTLNEQNAFLTACEELKKVKIIIDDTGGINILELRAKARRMKNQHNIACLFIDYLQLISIESNRNGSRENDVARISGALKALAKELEIPIVVLAQLNRAAEQNRDEQPKLSNLRESGAIEQDADVVALLHRNTAKQRELSEDDENGLDAELIIAKNRNGRVGIEKMVFLPQYTRYEEASEVSDADVPH